MSENENAYKLKEIHRGWMACLSCNKTFLGIQNAEFHLKNEHMDKDNVVNDDYNDNPDSDPDLGLAVLDDGSVICLRCTLLFSNITQVVDFKESSFSYIFSIFITKFLQGVILDLIVLVLGQCNGVIVEKQHY